MTLQACPMPLGLVSVTFRQLSPREIVGLVKQAELEAIEWGGDIHVPHGDIKAAREVKAMTEDAGLEVAAYGSYYRAGQSASFELVLESAWALEAPTVRIWAGTKGSKDTSEKERVAIAKDIRQCCEKAEANGMTVSLEYHPNTLTDDIRSCHRLIQDIKNQQLRLYWQPDVVVPHKLRSGDLESLNGHLANVHVFEWTWNDGQTKRHSLEEGWFHWSGVQPASTPRTNEDDVFPDVPSNHWAYDSHPRYIDRFNMSEAAYLAVLRRIEFAGYLLIEFVKGDSPEQFLRDAETLKRWRESIMKA